MRSWNYAESYGFIHSESHGGPSFSRVQRKPSLAYTIQSGAGARHQG